jgi:hypothetical protein
MSVVTEPGGRRPRPAERETLFNPRFVALLLAHAAAGHEDRTEAAMPLSLCFLVAPVVLHGPTRRALPRRVTTKPGAWLDEHPLLRAGFAMRARSTAPFVRAGLREGLRAGMLDLVGDGVLGHPPQRRGVNLSAEVDEILKRAAFAGGWLGLAGPPAGSFAMWRVRP